MFIHKSTGDWKEAGCIRDGVQTYLNTNSNTQKTAITNMNTLCSNVTEINILNTFKCITLKKNQIQGCTSFQRQKSSLLSHPHKLLSVVQS